MKEKEGKEQELGSYLLLGRASEAAEPLLLAAPARVFTCGQGEELDQILCSEDTILINL